MVSRFGAINANAARAFLDRRTLGDLFEEAQGFGRVDTYQFVDGTHGATITFETVPMVKAESGVEHVSVGDALKASIDKAREIRGQFK